jgi:ankyrin repeat protein
VTNKYLQKRTPDDLMTAVVAGSVNRVRALLEEGVNPNAINSSDPPLTWAAAYADPAIARLLLDKGADINARDRYGRTALIRAAETGCAEVVRLLIDRNAALEEKDKTGETALDKAEKRRYGVTAAILKEALRTRKSTALKQRRLNENAPKVIIRRGGHKP